MNDRAPSENKANPRRTLPRPGVDRRQRVCPELYQVVVECESERRQQVLFEELRKKGYSCRLLML